MTSEQTPLHDRPKVILACICSDFHEVSGGGFNLIRIYDSITVDRPTGVPPDIPLPLPVQAVTCWTEGVGEHVHQLRLLNEDGQPVLETPPVSFSLADFNARHWVVDRIILPVQRSERYTVEVSLGGDPDTGLRYVFTVTIN